ncbi:MAG TPA: GGDEF domain-containing protein [Polyangia bacterium]|nr:GGDEF domain-containing protein [Polyangia bacterium]
MADDWKTRITRVSQARAAPASEAQACLVLVYPPGAMMGRRFELGKDVIIGRGSDCQVQIDRDSVSRKHARIVRKSDTWVVHDLGSTNGTYVGNDPVHEQPLRDGDLLKVGSTIFKFLSGGSVEQAYFEEIYRMTIIDGLTEAYNKRYFMEYLDRELARCGRYGRPLSLVMFDIDHFKRINDEHGHLTGDHVLKELARRVRGEVRKDEVFARYGGEEFVVVLPEAGHDAAMKFAERLRQLVGQSPFVFEDDSVVVRISVGVASTSSAIESGTFIKQADDNLYRAKRGGRDRVIG